MVGRKGYGLLTLAALVVPLIATSTTAHAESPANPEFLSTWQRTDLPVVEGQAVRTWMWGPEAFTGQVTEDYAESPNGERNVQYFDKSRMEITDPNFDRNSVWFVTNGLLVVELVTGQMQTGDAAFEDRSPAQLNVAGDAQDPDGPTYATIGRALDQGPHAVGETVSQRLSRNGTLTYDAALSSRGITIAIIDDVTNHAIAAPFWEFMNASGTVYDGSGFVNAPLFENAYFATGRPIAEPAWADVQVGGETKLVLIQCFERRCLTYTPDNAPEWRVEAGNVGRHYHAWRYGS
jgi:hypothetical protein